MQNDLKKLLESTPDRQFIAQVIEFAKEYYNQKITPWGETYLSHVAGVALRLRQLNLDKKTVAGGILHDIVEVSNLPKEKILEKIEKKFGEEVATLVERFSELKRIYFSFSANKAQEFFAQEKIDNVRKMFLAIAKDLRVVLIELATRIDRLNKMEDFEPEKQKLYATETLQIFVPIANRLGLGEIKDQMADLAFAKLFEKEFKLLSRNIKEKYEKRQKYLKKFIPHLKKILKQEKLKFLDINYRAKSYWSTHQKLKRFNMDLNKIHDLVAIRIIVPDITTCYKTLGIIHKYYPPISEEIDDYIAKPKPNGYRSLHTTVFLEKDRISEIQIRTDQMQKEAEYGICAHWSYKEKIDLQKSHLLLQWTKEIPEFFKSFRIDFFENQVFVFTPKGDVISLPKGATPIDLAYVIHSDIGYHCETAKVNGKIVSLSKPLENGDIVEIITNKKHQPSPDWIKLVKTDVAKSHIKKAIASKMPGTIFSIPSIIKRKFFEISELAKKRKRERILIKKEKPNQIYLAGQKGMLVTVAKCCLPKPGDTVVAYLSRHRAAVLHKASCSNLKKLSKTFPEKIIEASWS